MPQKIIVIDNYIGTYGYSKQFVRSQMTGNEKNAILVKMSSLGGSVDHGLDIHNQFAEHGNVTVDFSAFNASIATVCALGAKTVRMNENSFYLIHKVLTSVDEWGTMNEDQIETIISKLEKQKQEIAKMTLQLAKMYVKKTGKTLDEILDLMKQETWLTADEAKEWGFVDEVYALDEPVNYMEDLQMVAMVTSNGLPDLPRKKENQQQAQVQQPIDEESLFNRIWARITNKQKSNSPNNKVNMDKQFLNVNKVLNVENLESSEEGVFLNEGQLEAIDGQIAQVDTLTNERNTANTERDAANTERDNAIAAFDAIDPSIASAEGYEAKETAIRNLLSARPGVNPPGTLENNDNTNTGDVDWEAINNLPHNKQVDKNA